MRADSRECVIPFPKRPNTATIFTGPKIVTDETKKAMKQILSDIQDGTFAKDWLLENRINAPHFKAMRKREADHQLEKVGKELRKLYSWNDSSKLI